MVTLLIPTMNRSDFLIRLLRYYKDVGFQGCICIGDSSNPMHIERTKKAIGAFQGRLNIVYREYPLLNDYECRRQLLEFVSTPYVAYVADDDFLVPTGLELCARFLDKNPDYSAAHGVAVGMHLKSNGAYGQAERTGRYRQPVIEGNSASQRLLEHLNNYTVTLFSVHRVDAWRAMDKDIALLADKGFGSELLPCCLSVIQGKVKGLDCLYLVRQDHVQRYFLSDTFDWITGPNWFPSYQTFHNFLLEVLVRQDGISVNEARAVVKQAFWTYLTICLSKEWQNKYGQSCTSSPQRWRQIVRTIPGAQRIWRLLYSLKPKKEDPFSLPALLRPSSPYHADFMPIYRAVTTPPAGADLQIINSTKETL